MWIEIGLTVLGILTITEVFGGGVIEGIGDLADKIIERRLKRRDAAK